MKVLYKVNDIIAIGQRYNYNYIAEINNRGYNGVVTDLNQIWVNNSLDYKGSDYRHPTMACLISVESNLKLDQPWLRKINVPDHINTPALRAALISDDRDSRNYAIEIIKQYE